MVPGSIVPELNLFSNCQVDFEPNTPDTVPAKPTKVPFDSFGGSPHRHIENISEFEKPVNLEASRQPLCQSILTYIKKN